MEMEAATAAGQQQRGPAAQPEAGSQPGAGGSGGTGSGGAPAAGAGDIVVSGASASRGGYLPETMARLAREWEATNREDPVIDVQGPITADGYAALVPAGE